MHKRYCSVAENQCSTHMKEHVAPWKRKSLGEWQTSIGRIFHCKIVCLGNDVINVRDKSSWLIRITATRQRHEEGAQLVQTRWERFSWWNGFWKVCLAQSRSMTQPGQSAASVEKLTQDTARISSSARWSGIMLCAVSNAWLRLNGSYGQAMRVRDCKNSLTHRD